MKVDRSISPLRTPIEWSALGSALDILCPMHLQVTETGHILHAGPTLRKLRPEASLIGQRFLEVFRLDRPRAITSMSELLARERSKLHLEFHDAPKTALKGVLVRLPQGQGALVNLSFGISVVEGVQDYGLSSADFAGTDLAIEMLYLVEAKSAAMDASHQLNQRLQGAKMAAEEQAATDILTGLKNRRAADDILARMIAERRDFALMHVDLDYFKAVNDSKGHAAGDYVLQKAADIMRSKTRKKDVIARVGGDEFMILICELPNKARLQDIADKLIKGIEEPIDFEGQRCEISASIGIAVHESGDHIHMDELVQNSDRALYASKRKGRACATFFDDLE